MHASDTLQSLSLGTTIDHHTESANNHVTELRLWRRLAEQASPSNTCTKELIRQSAFLAISTMNVGAGILWTLMYVYLGEYLAALMPTIYSTCMGVILVTCVC